MKININKNTLLDGARAGSLSSHVDATQITTYRYSSSPLLSTLVKMSEQDSNSCFSVSDLMADYLANYHYVLDDDAENFVEVYATFNGLNGLNISIYVNNMLVKVMQHVLDSECNFSLSSIVEIQRYNLNDNNQMIDIIYNGSAIYSYPHVRRPNDQRPDSDTNEDPMDTESLPELEPADHDEPVPDVEGSDEEPVEAAAASSADAKVDVPESLPELEPADHDEPVPDVEGSDEEPVEAAAASSTDAKVDVQKVSVDFQPGYDTPHSPVGSEDGLLQGCDTPFSPLPSPLMSEEEDDLMLSSLFGSSNPPSPRLSGFGSSNPPSPIGNRPQSPELENGYPIFMGQGLPSDPPSDLYPDEYAEFVINADRVEDDAIEE